VEKPIETIVRTRDLEGLLHLSKAEMKHLETISRFVQLDKVFRSPKGISESVREKRNITLVELRRHIKGERVDQIITKVAEFNGGRN
jgi:hypothetical protein